MRGAQRNLTSGQVQDFGPLLKRSSSLPPQENLSEPWDQATHLFGLELLSNSEIELEEETRREGAPVLNLTPGGFRRERQVLCEEGASEGHHAVVPSPANQEQGSKLVINPGI